MSLHFPAKQGRAGLRNSRRKRYLQLYDGVKLVKSIFAAALTVNGTVQRRESPQQKFTTTVHTAERCDAIAGRQ
jgi:hypothetical protein